MGFFNFSKSGNQEDDLASKLTPNSLDKALTRSKQKETIEEKKATSALNSDFEQLNYSQIAPYPVELKDLGVSEHLLLTLLLKHLYADGVSTLRELATKLKLSGTIVQHLVDSAKNKSYIENIAQNTNEQMRLSLSSVGAIKAEKEFLKSGYLGPAPVPLEQYIRVCKEQTSRKVYITMEALKEALHTLSFSNELLEQVGPSLNSTKPILIYGDAGTGKSYFCRHLNRVFGGDVLIPHAIEVNSEIIQIFDPEVHFVQQKELQENVLQLASSHDPRWLLCKRPLVVSGGELSLDMLEVQYDLSTRTYRAPLQLKANNGILLLDDLGRQKITAKELFNRWIIPLEEQRDFLALQSGLHFEIPFEFLLLFSTNLTPTDLVDEAFLRRLGYKIEFKPLSNNMYKEIWFNECKSNNVHCSEEMFELLLEKYHKKYHRYLLPCYPRDLLGIASDQIKFKQLGQELTEELLDFAWHSYFVK